MRMTRTRTLGIRVDSLPSADIPLLLDMFESGTPPVLCTFVNPASVAAAKRDDGYRQRLEDFDAVLPDGIGMCWAIRLLHGMRPARISFDTTSLAPLVFARAQRSRRTVALVGGRPAIAEQAAAQLRQAFPALQIVATLDGYGNRRDKLRTLRALSPAVVICGMGAGAQERYLLELAETGWRGAGFTCGGYLDQLAGGLHYYPRWVDAANLRWAYRLIREPRRLGRRYTIDYGIFAARVALALVRSGLVSEHRRERRA